MDDNWEVKNFGRDKFGELSINCLINRSFTAEGWCLISSAGGGMVNERRVNLRTKQKILHQARQDSPWETNLKLKFFEADA